MQVRFKLLPILVPLVLNLCKLVAVFRIPRWIESCAEYFLDADRDGDVDIADAMQMAGRYLSR